jgi:hypothetical protein
VVTVADLPVTRVSRERPVVTMATSA